jgi:hypothetical protein
MKRPWLVIALLLSVGINIGILAMVGTSKARQRGARHEMRWDRNMEGREGRPGSGPPVEALADRLGLEGAERGQFIAHQEEFFQSFERIREELGMARHDLRREAGAAQPDRERIEELLAQTARLTAELNRGFVDNVLATRELLGPEQEERYFAMLERLRERGEGRWRGGDGPPDRGRRPGGPGGR